MIYVGIEKALLLLIVVVVAVIFSDCVIATGCCAVLCNGPFSEPRKWTTGSESLFCSGRSTSFEVLKKSTCSLPQCSPYITGILVIFSDTNTVCKSNTKDKVLQKNKFLKEIFVPDLFLLHVTVLRLPGKESKLSSVEPLQANGSSFLLLALSCYIKSTGNAVKVVI